MAKNVNMNKRQFNIMVDLQDKVMDAWNHINLKYMQILLKYFTSRLISVVLKQGQNDLILVYFQIAYMDE